MEYTSQWKHKEEWHRHGNDFLVVVKRHSVEPSGFARDEGPHRWAVYAYVYPEHQTFGNFSGTDMRQQAAVALPLHGGPSLLRWHYDDDGKRTSVQIGSDYNHLHDEEFTTYADADDAYEVFADADRLFSHLKDKGVCVDSENGAKEAGDV
jgi:hypothetical protein